MTYIILFILLVSLELLYFKIAKFFNIVDKPNERSSHHSIVLRGGGIIFLLAVWLWGSLYGIEYPCFFVGLTLVAGASFIDDVHSLKYTIRLFIQFISVALMFVSIGFYHHLGWYWSVPLALIVFVGAINIYNFMDGINGITGAYSLSVLIPLWILNKRWDFIDESLIIVIILADLVFSFFNFRPKAKCFNGDVGSVGMAFILLFFIGRLILYTEDVTWLIVMMIYGVDGCLTIIHRIMLHENIGKAHRKHVFQLMANELKIPQLIVSSIYAVVQLCISIVLIYLIPDTLLAHWLYFISVLILLCSGYVVFMKKYYHLHEEYLRGLEEADHLKQS